MSEKENKKIKVADLLASVSSGEFVVVSFGPDGTRREVETKELIESLYGKGRQ